MGSTLQCRSFVALTNVVKCILSFVHNHEGGDIAYNALHFGGLQKNIERGGWFAQSLSWIKDEKV